MVRAMMQLNVTYSHNPPISSHPGPKGLLSLGHGQQRAAKVGNTTYDLLHNGIPPSTHTRRRKKTKNGVSLPPTTIPCYGRAFVVFLIILPSYLEDD